MKYTYHHIIWSILYRLYIECISQNIRYITVLWYHLLFVLSEVNSINMSAIDRFNISSIVIDSDWSSSVNTSDCNSITRHNTINQFSVTRKIFLFEGDTWYQDLRMNWDGMRSFTSRHFFWGLLEFYNLFTNEFASIVNDLHRFCCL